MFFLFFFLWKCIFSYFWREHPIPYLLFQLFTPTPRHLILTSSKKAFFAFSSLSNEMIRSVTSHASLLKAQRISPLFSASQLLSIWECSSSSEISFFERCFPSQSLSKLYSSEPSEPSEVKLLSTPPHDSSVHSLFLPLLIPFSLVYSSRVSNFTSVSFPFFASSHRVFRQRKTTHFSSVLPYFWM